MIAAITAGAFNVLARGREAENETSARMCGERLRWGG